MSPERPPGDDRPDGPKAGDRPVDEFFRSNFTPEEPPSEAVIRSVAALVDAEPMSMAVLQHAIDGDALDALVSDAGGVAVEFSYSGYLVTVRSDGSITLRLPNGTA